MSEKFGKVAGGGNFTADKSTTDHMKRCNNCGWFNLDSVTHCEKCDEESFELVVEIPEEESKEATEAEPVEKQAEPTIIEEESSCLKGTVAFNMPEPEQQAEQPSPAPKKALAATIMDASGVIASASTIQCHKCNYPIAGLVEYCPNCGATIKRSSAPVKEVSEVETHPKPVPAKELNRTVRIDAISSHKPSAPKSGELKATVRDIPDELMSDDKEVSRLVPVGELGEAVIELRDGCEVVIGGHRYRFEK